MIKYVLAMVLLSVPFVAKAQQAGHMHSPGSNHGAHGATKAVSRGATEPGQGAFAAIQEIVGILQADPNTNWSKVDIDGLRQHLVDMNNVTLYATSAAAPIENGMRFVVTGTGAVRDSIRRMVGAHAETMTGANGMTILAEDNPEGATMTVTVSDPADLAKLKALGFFGVLALGMHHQRHHLLIATGHAPHG